MADKVIDLTASPPSPPPPPKTARILKFKASSASSKKIQFKIKKSSQPSWAQNPSPSYINPQVAPWVPTGRQTHDFYQIIDGHRAQAQAQLAAAYEPHVSTPNAFLFSGGTKLMKPWTFEEHQQFLTGLAKFGRGNWTKIARHFVLNKTPQQVQSYATSFFRHMHMPATYLYNFRKKNPNSATFITSGDPMASASHSNPLMMEKKKKMTKKDMGPPPTLMLFPHSSGYSSSNALDKSAVAPNMASNEGEVDLELRLG